MATSKKQAEVDIEYFFAGLNTLFNSLPTESQKQEINGAFTELIKFLSDLQIKSQAMPSIEDVSHVNQSLQKVSEYFNSAVKTANAATRKTSSGASKQKGNGESAFKPETDPKELLIMLEHRSDDEIRAELGKRSYTKAYLDAIALELGIPHSKTTKDILVDKIAKAIQSESNNRKMAAASDDKATSLPDAS